MRDQNMRVSLADYDRRLDLRSQLLTPILDDGAFDDDDVSGFLAQRLITSDDDNLFIEHDKVS